MGKTVRELADEFSVSKQAISKLLTKEFRANYVTNKKVKGTNQLVVSEEGYSALKDHYDKGINQQPISDNIVTNVDTNLVDSLKNHIESQTKELDEKNKQIINKDEQLKTMQKLLDQSQQLQLMAENKIKQLEDSSDKSDVESSKEKPKKKSFWSKIF